MKNKIINIIIACTALILITSCDTAQQNNKTTSIACLSVIMSDGSDEMFPAGGQQLSSVTPADSLEIIAVVMALDTDSVQIFYASSVYGNGYETKKTSLKLYNDYESHRIKTFLNAPK